jgi:hypothetical protein
VRWTITCRLFEDGSNGKPRTYLVIVELMNHSSYNRVHGALTRCTATQPSAYWLILILVPRRLSLVF